MMTMVNALVPLCKLSVMPLTEPPELICAGGSESGEQTTG